MKTRRDLRFVMALVLTWGGPFVFTPAASAQGGGQLVGTWCSACGRLIPAGQTCPHMGGPGSGGFTPSGPTQAQIDRQEALSLNAQGVQFAGAGRLREAVDSFEAALRLSPGDGTIRENLRLSRLALARKIAREAAEADARRRDAIYDRLSGGTGGGLTLKGDGGGATHLGPGSIKTGDSEGFGIPGLPGIYVGGPRPGSGPANDMALKFKLGDAFESPVPPPMVPAVRPDPAALKHDYGTARDAALRATEEDREKRLEVAKTTARELGRLAREKKESGAGPEEEKKSSTPEEPFFIEDIAVSPDAGSSGRQSVREVTYTSVSHETEAGGHFAMLNRVVERQTGRVTADKLEERRTGGQSVQNQDIGRYNADGSCELEWSTIRKNEDGEGMETIRELRVAPDGAAFLTVTGLQRKADGSTREESRSTVQMQLPECYGLAPPAVKESDLDAEASGAGFQPVNRRIWERVDAYGGLKP